MVFRAIMLFVAFFFAAASQSSAADQLHTYPVKQALKSALAKEKLVEGVSVYMHGQKHPAVQKKMREFRSNKRSGGSDQNACDKAFLSAVIALQERAFREEGDAVIDIYSTTGNKRHRSADTYTCNVGRAMVNVVLMGTVVNLGN